MAALLLLLLFSLLSLSGAVDHRLHFTDPSRPSLSVVPPQVTQACKATRFRDLCVSSLSRSKPPLSKYSSPSIPVILAAVAASSDGLNTAQSMVKSLLTSSSGHRSLNLTVHSKNCLQILPLSRYRMSSTATVLPRGRVKDARAYMSAALEYQYNCWSELSYANETAMVDRTMSYLNTLMSLTSNALSMIVAYDVRGAKMESWSPPATERDGFWESSPGRGPAPGFAGGVPRGLAADATVCKAAGQGCHQTVQDAVNAAPNNAEKGRRFVIHIKEGVYHEIVRVPLQKKNVVFVGDGAGVPERSDAWSLHLQYGYCWSAWGWVHGRRDHVPEQGRWGCPPSRGLHVGQRPVCGRGLRVLGQSGHPLCPLPPPVLQVLPHRRECGLHLWERCCGVPGLHHPGAAPASHPREGREQCGHRPREDRPGPVDGPHFAQLLDQRHGEVHGAVPQQS
ncbi:hypothetical protein BT93_H3738 [Corymbia citriodora subsp. variegata]|nr:hypothetical protein BT93_H3738 [Corymbia citriodora subsp. variegata]